MKTCGECAHWKSHLTTKAHHGVCDATVPDWCVKHIMEDAAWLRHATASADDCQCFTPLEEVDE